MATTKMTGGRPQSNDAYVRATPTQIAAAKPTAPPPAATAPSDTPAAPVATPAAPVDTTAQTDQTNAQNATQSITATLTSLGLGGMAGWATSLAYQLAGQGIDPTTIINTITSQMNDPKNADGSENTDARNAFDTALPGFNQLIATTGNNGSPGASPAAAIANYINYSTQVQQFSQQAGLLPGTITPTEIGNLWSGQVSTSEVSQRITDAVNLSNPNVIPTAVSDYLANNYGMSSQALASYFLNPANTLTQITSNMNAGMVGGAAAASGFDQNLSTAQAQALGAFLANGSSPGNSSQIGSVNSVSYSGGSNSALGAFEGGLGSNGTSTGALGSAAQMANAGYISGNLPGQQGGQLSEDTLLGAVEGNASALQQTQQAEQTRTAGAKGGGGATTTANGAVGLGYANE